MGNYKSIETEFIERTLHLISQYESTMHRYKFEEQFNHTLLINCMLGLIVFPKERTISYLPNEIIDKDLKGKMGIVKSTFHTDIITLKSLITALRHTLAHFDITFESHSEEYLIDRIVFNDRGKGANYVVAAFIPGELLNFLRYYSTWVLSILKEHHNMV